MGEDAGLDSSGWELISNRPDAFGGSFHAILCSPNGTATCTWSFPDNVRNSDGELGDQGSSGWSYSVYAWIPNVVQNEFTDSAGSYLDSAGMPYPRTQDATYTITYKTGANTTTTDTITVDQSVAGNQGKWVLLGASYFDVVSVALSNIAQPDSTGVDSTGALTGVASQEGYVVADAIMIVPDTMGAFGYCTPVAEVTDTAGQLDATGIFAVNAANGRVLKFDIPAAVVPNTDSSGSIAPIAKVDWIYPDVRHSLTVTGSADADQPSLGPMGASPTYSYSSSNGGRLYIACLAARCSV